MNNNNLVWVCTKDKDHVFEERTSTGFCTKCIENFQPLLAARLETSRIPADLPGPKKPLPPINLEEKFNRLNMEGDELFQAGEYVAAKEKFEQALALFPKRDDIHDKINQCEAYIELGVGVGNPTLGGELGLCVLLMDASGSMFKPNVFENSEMNRAQVVTKAAARGIMNLRDQKQARDAYLAIYKFDHRVKPICLKSIAEIIREYSSEAELEQFLYNSMSSDMGGETDINQALQTAHALVSDFLNQKMSVFRNARGNRDYPIKHHAITNERTMDQVEVPNVRVFIYTDGIQCVDGETTALTNPFKQGGGLVDSKVDLLLGAFIGEARQNGYRELKAIISDCPRHDKEQFFLIQSPEDGARLSKVFSMASEGSGFCDTCLKQVDFDGGHYEMTVSPSW